MPRLDDFNPKLKKFKPVKYMPWDNSPSGVQEEANKNTSQKNIIANEIEHLGDQVFQSVAHKFEPVQTRFKRGSNEVQTRFKRGSNGVQINSQTGSNGVQNRFKRGSNFDDKLLPTNQLDLEKKHLSELIGSQKKLLIFIIKSCVNSDSFITHPLNTTELSSLLLMPKDTIKTSIKRLKEKHLIKTVEFKYGFGGFTKFKITEFTKSQYLETKELGLEMGFKWGSNGNNVCSSNNITTTTVPEIFQQIDYSPLTKFGFDKSHIIQIYREYTKNPELALTTEIIQNSINALAFDLKHNDVAASFKNSPVVVLTALLKKGQPYSSKTPEKVLTPQEEAMQEYLLAQEKKQQKILKFPKLS